VRFRYLIAVPFVDHGSEVSFFESRDLGTDEISTVIPRAIISPLDFSIYRESFERLPNLILGLRPATFSFEPESNAVSYTNFPSPQEFADYFRRPTNFARYMTARQSAATALYKRLEQFPSIENVDHSTAMLKHLRLLLTTLSQAAPYLMATVCFDEHLFYAVLDIGNASVIKRNAILGAILSSPFTRHAATYPTELVALKRVKLPCSSYFVAKPIVQSDLHAKAPSAADIEWTLTEKRLLNLAKVVYNASEELLFLWGSAMSQVSFAITSMAPPSQYGQILSCKSTQLFEFL
jgi:hypothetical protein